MTRVVTPIVSLKTSFSGVADSRGVNRDRSWVIYV